MNWKSILALSLFGILMGIISINGLSQGVLEIIFWLIIAIISALVLDRTAKAQLVTHGFIVGFLDALFHGIILAIFSTTYFINNPGAEEKFSQLPEGIPLEFYPIIQSVPIGLIYGLFIGLLVFLTRKGTKRKFSEHQS